MSLLANIGIMTRNPSGGGGTDPYWANVVALLNMGGADGSTTFTDSTGLRSWTTLGSAQVDTSLGYNAAEFPSSTAGINTPYIKADFDWWTTDYTIEAWINPTAPLSNWIYSGNPRLISCATPESNVNYWSFGPIASGQIRFFYYPSSTVTVDSVATISTGTLSHIAICKNASGIIIAVNGVVASPVAVVGTPLSSPTAPVKLSLGRMNASSIIGFVKAVRLTKGVARYTTSYTPPAAPFPTS